MQIAQTVKRAPKWAWYTVGGVAVGGLAIKFWHNRTDSSGGTPLGGDSAVSPTVMGGSSGFAGTGSPGSVIVPPVILPANQDTDSGAGLFSGVLSGFNDMITGVGDVYQGVYSPILQGQFGLIQTGMENQQRTIEGQQGMVQGILDSGQASQHESNDLLENLVTHQSDWFQTILGSLNNTIERANAGSAPQPTLQNPTPVVTDVPAPAPAVAVQPPAPTPAPVIAQPAHTADPCTGEFPNQSARGCYKVVCASGKGDHAKGRWHFYKNGPEEHVRNTC